GALGPFGDGADRHFARNDTWAEVEEGDPDPCGTRGPALRGGGRVAGRVGWWAWRLVGPVEVP
ncbi:MAG: hypothetical protein MUQ26_01300, partial [Armatimonadetes bacterium]|nr:hypothetical protein [Armatimonadota bacterium]